jgi:drug/metabolite transporter superfamily protein YnfA
MRKQIEKHASSLGFWIFIVVCVYLAYALYFAVYGLSFSIELTSDTYVYNLVSKNPWWWQILYYGSEGVAGSVAIVLRAIAAFFALYSAFLYWRKKDNAIPQIKRSVGTAILLEAGFFLALIPSIIAAFAYNASTEYLFYFDHTPELILLYGTAIPCLAIILVVPPLLLKLRAAILHGSSSQDVLKWTSLTGIAYLFVVFWFNYSMLWAANLVPYPRPQQQYGLDFLFQPTNFVSFAVTVVGLLAIATSALIFTFPAIKKQRTKLNTAGIGAVMTAFGGYFIFNTLFYYLTGEYKAHPSVWYEVIGPLHNPNLWCIAFIFLGSAILIRSRIKEPG